MALTLRKSLLLGVIAEESAKTKKARQKLKQKLDATDKKLTSQALQKKSQEIAKWIERHTHDRVSVKKDIPLFDRNQNPAKMSRNLERLAAELSTSTQTVESKKK